MDFNYDHMCFACGEGNVKGLKLKFFKEGNKIITEFIASEEHQGYPGIMHGGLITTILDELMSRSVNSLGFFGVTARMEIRFREQVPIGEKIRYESKIINERKKVVDLEGKAILPNGKIAAETMARFMIMGDLKDFENC
ncbi:Acyl-coenzyme A thioesterase PaaI, contains HGG motif [Desulfonispora thiosulfatigenes DSM 11270]|uniref:Acyl-coenzyme A thioesterase PaaI, contains HGG motif n=1 Tax=Desulfonispora thiosulfatigenes DSM 11270 TaxID=656914 RepID=A0A1W1UVT7_DESTI|nr:hotdog fold domain-containing protein [Desulfonispora thiosulfatigenes]SMB85278.1 Acyl-coenzyme A thioesterase PaaI, contains HGG motif [Desulfonispora thiosulfatigenes DSM 11270]